jgi:hypothetical protein
MRNLNRLVGCLLLMSPVVFASGMSTSFFDVQVKDVVPGKPYDVTAMTGKRLDLQNLSEKEMSITLQPLQPKKEELRPAAVPVPDVAWIQITPGQLAVVPHGVSYADIVIKVPAGRAYRGKTFQAMIWSRGQVRDAKGGVVMSPALLSRLRFTTRS